MQWACAISYNSSFGFITQSWAILLLLLLPLAPLPVAPAATASTTAAGALLLLLLLLLATAAWPSAEYAALTSSSPESTWTQCEMQDLCQRSTLIHQCKTTQSSQQTVTIDCVG
jgi:hypothetical protein